MSHESSKDSLKFDEEEPGGVYELDLSRIFDRSLKHLHGGVHSSHGHVHDTNRDVCYRRHDS